MTPSTFDSRGARLDWIVPAGTDASLLVTVTIDGLPADLTDAVFDAAVYRDGEEFITLPATASIGRDDQFTVSCRAVDTASVDWVKNSWALGITQDGNRTVMLAGTFEVTDPTKGGGSASVEAITLDIVNDIVLTFDAGGVGPAGPTGPQGIQGPQGEVGPQGSIGLTGPQGVQGPQGEVGPRGDTGPQGVQGIQGPVGSVGPKGDTGPQGEPGVSLGFDPVFEYNKVSNVLNIPETWTTVNQLAVDAPAGTYLWGIAATWRFDSTTRSALVRFSNDNGQTWGAEYSMEPGDTTDLYPFFYQFPIVHPGGTRQVLMQCRKESAGGQLDITFCDLYYQRVG